MVGPASSPALVPVPSLTCAPLPSTTADNCSFETSRKVLMLATWPEKWYLISLTPGLQFSQYQISSDAPHELAAPGTCLYVLLPPGALSVMLKTRTPGARGPGMAMRILPSCVGAGRSMSETCLGPPTEKS